MARSYWHDRLNDLLTDVIRDRNLQAKLLSHNSRWQVLRDADFSELVIDLLMQIEAQDITGFVNQADRLISQAKARLDTEVLYPVSVKAARDLEPAVRQRGYSRQFAEKFSRVAAGQIGRYTTDLLVVHLSDELSVEDLLRLFNHLDAVYKTAGATVYGNSFGGVFTSKERLLRPREFRYGSAEFFLDIVPRVIELIGDLTAFINVSDHMNNALFAIMWPKVVQNYRLIRARRQPDGDIQLDSPPSAEKAEQQDAMESTEAIEKPNGVEETGKPVVQNLSRSEHVEVITTTVAKTNHFAIGQRKILTWGGERTTSVRRQWS